MSRHPEVKWAQRKDKIFLTVQLPDAKNAKVNLEPEGLFTFSANAGADNLSYEVRLELHDKVNVEESKINVGVRNIFCVVEKAEKAWWKKLLSGEGKAPHYLKVDWDKWVDEDEDDGIGDLDLGGMDFSNFGDGGMGDLDGSDDEEEVAKPEGDAKGELSEDSNSKGEEKENEKSGDAKVVEEKAGDGKDNN